jgi:L-lactate permease
VWLQAFTDPLRGKTALWKVIWIYGFAASIVYTVLGWILVPETPTGIGIYVVLGLALGVVQSVMLWKCAYNSRFPGAGRLLRIVVVAGLLTIPLMLYVLFRNPEALLPPN